MYFKIYFRGMVFSWLYAKYEFSEVSWSLSCLHLLCIFEKKIRQIKSSAYRFYEDVKYTTYHERPQTEIHTLCHWLFPCKRIQATNLAFGSLT